MPVKCDLALRFYLKRCTLICDMEFVAEHKSDLNANNKLNRVLEMVKDLKRPFEIIVYSWA